jgi:hypothetical protein
MNKNKAVFATVGIVTLIAFGFQNCSKVTVSDIASPDSSVNGDGLNADPNVSGPGNNGGGNPNLPPGTPTTPGTPIAPNPPPNPPTDNPPTTPDNDPKEWLAKNCDPAVLRQKSLDLEFIPDGPAVRKQQLNMDVLEVSNAQSFSGNQISAKKILIEKSGEVELQQAFAAKIEIEALSISKLHQIGVGELFVRASKVLSDIHQIGGSSSAEPKIAIQSPVVKSIHQVQALCLRTKQGDSVHQVSHVLVLGEGEGAHLDKIHQSANVEIQDLKVDEISQSEVVVLKNSHVGKVKQVGKLFLINSTVDEMDQVGIVAED